jgi:mono/diheme cytochrome c family protein
MRRKFQFLSGIAFCTCMALYGTTPVSGQSADSPAATFKMNCVLCHGEDGKGTAAGKSLNVKDLTSKEVQAETEDTLKNVILNGKNNMPPFKSAVSDDMATALVKYVRTFAAKSGAGQ